MRMVGTERDLEDRVTAKLETPDGVIELPTVAGTEAPSALDISKLLGQHRVR